MDREVAKAINNLSKKVNGLVQRIDNVLGSRCDENEESITNAEQSITDLDLRSMESEQAATDLDLKVLELEESNNE